MELRELVLKTLQGSNSRKPISTTDMVRITEHTSSDEICGVLEELVNSKVVGKCSSIKDGKADTVWWLSGGLEIPAHWVNGRVKKKFGIKGKRKWES